MKSKLLLALVLSFFNFQVMAMEEDYSVDETSEEIIYNKVFNSEHEFSTFIEEGTNKLGDLYDEYIPSSVTKENHQANWGFLVMFIILRTITVGAGFSQWDSLADSTNSANVLDMPGWLGAVVNGAFGIAGLSVLIDGFINIVKKAKQVGDNSFASICELLYYVMTNPKKFAVSSLDVFMGTFAMTNASSLIILELLGGDSSLFVTLAALSALIYWTIEPSRGLYEVITNIYDAISHSLAQGKHKDSFDESDKNISEIMKILQNNIDSSSTHSWITAFITTGYFGSLVAGVSGVSLPIFFSLIGYDVQGLSMRLTLLLETLGGGIMNIATLIQMIYKLVVNNNLERDISDNEGYPTFKAKWLKRPKSLAKYISALIGYESELEEKPLTNFLKQMLGFDDEQGLTTNFLVDVQKLAYGEI